MVRVNHDLMRRRRIELGRTPEELAEESALDARTVRRMEQGRSRTRLKSAIAVAEALNLDLSVLILEERTTDGMANDEGGALSAAFTAAGNAMQRELVREGEWGLREALYVLSLLLTRSLVLDTKAAGEHEEGDTDRVLAAFKAADSAIQTTLSCGGEWGEEEAACVLSLLLARYGTAFGRRSEDGVEGGFRFIQSACDQAKRALPHYLASE